MSTLLLMYLTAAYTNTLTSLKVEEGETVSASLKREYGEYWWAILVVTAPIAFGKKSIKVIESLIKKAS